MKVVHIVPTYFSSESILGWGERFVVELAKAMSSYVTVEIISFGQTNKTVYLSNSLKLFVFKRWNKNIFNPFFLKRLKGADIIHCYQYIFHFTKLAIIFAKIFKKRVFVTDLGVVCPEPLWYFDWSKWIDKFLVISKFSERFLAKYYAPKEVIYGGVDIQKYNPAAQKENKVLFVGRLLPHKGINYLIEAMPANIELDIIGQPYDNKYYQLLQRLAENKKINFLHNLTDEEAVSKFAKASLLALPSIHKNELWSLVILEAMACGCAVIATNVGGIPEIILDGKTGFLLPPNDPVMLREKIEYLIGNPDIARQMGIAGRRRVEEEFTWDLVAKRCLKAYGV